MNQKRKATLQRKLSMTSVPRPPAGLLDRIKADIPNDLLSTDRDRERLSRSTALTMRVAASVLLLVSSVYLTLHIMSRSQQKPLTSALNRPPAMQPGKTAEPAAAEAPQAEVTITLADNKDQARVEDKLDAAVQRPDGAEKPAALIARSAKKIERDEDNRRNEMREEPARGIGATTGAVSAVAAAAPAPPAQSIEGEAKSRAETMTVTASAPEIVNSARAADSTFAPPRAVFGISVDPAAFDRVKHEIEQGARPSAGSVDVAALVNYFAGSGRPPRRDVRLDVEASRAPLASDNTALLRFTVDTPHERIVPGASIAPAATNADLEIWLNTQAVASHRLIGAEELKSQATLLKNLSVTGLVGVRLKPGVSPRTTIATLTLRYRKVDDGKWRTVTRTVYAADVSRTWAASSRRHRLATLGAVWSESLNGGTASGDVAGTAEKLATEAPGDARARDLAAVATAFSRLQSSGPTGSGR